jgi:crotonobetainyl-CoA:carnitine CoA-transferase CaiB-like acyl-CoA transferase
MGDDALPLAGLRVIDVGTRISAPFCAGLLGEMGAEVIKVEDPRGGDFMRTIGPSSPRKAPEGGHREPEGEGRRAGRVLALVGGRGSRPQGGHAQPAPAEGPGALSPSRPQHADVVCENFRPGTLEAWNIGPEDCDPRLVWARISVFGQDGPNARRPGLDRMGIAYGGCST